MKTWLSREEFTPNQKISLGTVHALLSDITLDYEENKTHTLSISEADTSNKNLFINSWSIVFYSIFTFVGHLMLNCVCVWD